MKAAGAWLGCREHSQLPVSRARAHSDPTAVIPGWGRPPPGSFEDVQNKGRSPTRGEKELGEPCARPRDVILGAAPDHRGRSEKNSLVNIGPGKNRLPTCAAGFRGDYFLRKCTGELKGAQVKSQTDKDEKRDTQSY